MIQRSKKICLLGDFGVGKTSLIRRFVESRFDDRYLSTIGVVVSRKLVALERPAPTALTMLIWDTAGSDAFSAIVQSYYRGSAGAILVCDLTRPDSLASLQQYAHEIHTVSPGIPFVIVANKVDLAGQRELPDEQLAAMAAAISAPWFLSSALTGEGVEPAFQSMAASVA